VNKKYNDNDIVIYQSKNGSIQIKRDIDKDTIWLTQDQMCKLFNVQKAAISKHLKNIFSSGELNEKSVVSILETTAKDLKTYKVNHYNLDVAISLGYRINSVQATNFRQWATKILRGHIVDGYTLNKQRIKDNYEQFSDAVDHIKVVVKSAQIDNDSVIELISMFANTWLSLDAYDKDQLLPTGTSKKKVTLTADKLSKALQDLKKNLISKGEATELFAAERSKESVSGIIGNVMQSFGGEDLYPTIEEKAAHLLYFMVKNHPFADGNKRSGAYAFIWFLNKSKMLDLGKITPAALTAMTLLIAESDPRDKDKMTGLICKLLSK
jgi:hypothetical protein